MTITTPDRPSHDTHPLVSVIVIFLNAGTEFFVEAIESVRAQTYTHWELLLVDDGSTDESTAIARDYAAREQDRIRYLEHPGHENRGMSATRNRGLNEARGTFVGFLDADDLWLPHKLEQQLSWFERCPEAAMVYGRTQIWWSWHPDFRDGARDRYYDLGVVPDRAIEPPQLATALLQNRAQTPTTCNALVRRSVIDAVGGFEDSFRGMFEDQVFFLKVELDYPVVVANETWARYRQHPYNRSAVGWNTPAYRQARLRFLDWVQQYLITQQITSPAVWHVFHREYRPFRYPRTYRLAGEARRLGGRAWARFRRLFGRRAAPRHQR